MARAPRTKRESGLQAAMVYFGLREGERASPPPSAKALRLLAVGAAVGLALIIFTDRGAIYGVPHYFGIALLSACSAAGIRGWWDRRKAHASAPD
jgi:hypothetical protein